MKKLFICLIAIAAAVPARSQDCADGTGNIFNEHVLIGRRAIEQLPSSGRVFALTDDGRCVGETLAQISPPSAQALPLTIWQDDSLTSDVEGLRPGESFRVFGQKEWGTGDAFPLIYESDYEADGISYSIEAAFDTVTVALLDSLDTIVSDLSAAFDSTAAADSTTIAQLTQQRDTYLTQRNNARAQRDAALADLATMTARADSLQTVVDAFPDDYDSLQTRIDELEAELATTNTRLTQSLNALRVLLRIVQRRNQ